MLIGKIDIKMYLLLKYKVLIFFNFKIVNYKYKRNF